jgi:hypothetical protein
MQKTQLALFPLQLFLLPGETTRLHIFEERYRQLLADCENIQLSFGIPYTRDGYMSGFGSMVELKRVIKRYANGSADIEIEATGIFKIERFFLRMGEKLYPGGEVSLMDQAEVPAASNEIFAAFDAYLNESDRPMNSELFSARLTLLDIARLLDVEDEKKLKLLKLDSEEAREKFILSEINLRKLLLAQKNSVENNIFLN